jgi:hypothetical protein
LDDLSELEAFEIATVAAWEAVIKYLVFERTLHAADDHREQVCWGSRPPSSSTMQPTYCSPPVVSD